VKKFLILFFALILTIVPVLAQTIQQGPYGSFFRVSTAAGGAGGVTLTVDQMVGLLIGTPTAGSTYTTPTATALCNAFPAVINAGNPSSFGLELFVVNTAGGADTITMAGGTGVTATGTLTIPQNDVKHFVLYPTSCVSGSQAWTLYSVSASGAN
jgi:hypothetical protein